MLVSRKNLSLIHLVAGEPASGFDVLKPLHQRVILCPTSRLRRKLFEPFAKDDIQCFVTGASYRPSLFDQVRVRAERNVPHTSSVYTILVHKRSSFLFMRTQTDDREKPPGLRALLAVTEEKIGSAPVAKVGREDVLWA